MAYPMPPAPPTPDAGEMCCPECGYVGLMEPAPASKAAPTAPSPAMQEAGAMIGDALRMGR